MDAVAIAAAVRSGDLAATEPIDAAIRAIETLNPTLNAVVLEGFEAARRSASAVDRDAPLAAVPFLLKDVDLFAKEWPTTMSSRFYAEAAPREDSEIVRRWRAAGVLLLGKTNTPEFADDFVTEPRFRGATLNPWNTQISVGGSSGGAASAVASAMVPAAHGSDVGGSIRIPSACCGVFGLKPSRGLNPSGPYFGAEGGGLNTEHVLTRTVRDSAAFLDATAGPEPGGHYVVPKLVRSYLEALEHDCGALRVVCLPHRLNGTPVAPEIERSLAHAARLLGELGHSVTIGEYPRELLEAMSGFGWTPLWMMDVALAIEERKAALGREPGEDEIEPLARWILRHARGLSAFAYIEAKRAAHRASLAMARAFGDYDLIMTPSTATLPPWVGAWAQAEPFDYESWAASSYGFAPFSEVFNVTGQPAASLPLFVSSSGVPIGIQLAAPRHRDDLLLQIAAQLEEATDWPRRIPPIWAGALRPPEGLS